VSPPALLGARKPEVRRVQVGAAKIFAEWLAPSDRAAVGDLRDVAKLAQDSVRASTRTVVAAPVADAERGTGRSE